MNRTRSRFGERVGSSWSGYLPLWAIAITVWCVNSTLLLGFALSPNQFGAAVAANGTAAVVLLLIGASWRALLKRRTVVQPVQPWVVFLVGAFTGLAKGLTTYLVLWVLTDVPVTFSALVQNTLPAVVIGLWLVPAFGILGSIRADYNSEREQLISEMVAHDLSAATTRYLDEDIARFVVRAKEQLDRAGDSPDLMRTALVELAERDVRPMSHKLWQQEDAQIDSFRFRDLALNAIKQHRFPAVWTSASLFISLLFLQIPLVGLLDSLQRSLFQSFVTLLVLSLGRLLPFRGSVSGPLIFFLFPAVAVIAIEVLTLQLAGPLPGVTSWIADVTLYFALIMTLLILGIVFSARDTHEEVRDRLTALRSDSLSTDVDRIIYLLRRRETAELLHGYVQNQLLSSSIKLGTTPHSLSEVKEHITSMFTELERGQLAPGSSSTLTLQSMKEQLTESWRGVMDITMSLSSRDTFSPREIALIDRLVTECASNARRHGHATTLHLDLTSTADSLTVVASDNGVGPGYGAPGLGTALMASLSAGNWSRKLSASQSGTTVTCTISRVKESTS